MEVPSNPQSNIKPIQQPSPVVGQAVIKQPNDIVSTTWENIVLLKPEWLSDDGVVYELKLFILDISDSADPADAGNAFKILYDLLGKAPRLAEERPDLFREYLRMLAILKSCLLSTMTDKEVAAFLRENLLLTMEVEDFDVTQKLQDVLLLARGFPIRIEDLRNMFLRAVEENNEFLGAEGLLVKGEEAARAPTVRNWLAIYRQFAAFLTKPQAKEVRRGGLERSAFITQNENVRKLSKDEQAILLRLLEFYDWLQFGVGKQEVVEKPLQKVDLSPGPSPQKERGGVPLTRGVALEAFKQRIEGSKTQAPTRPQAPALTPQEIKREVSTPELPGPQVIPPLAPPILGGEQKAPQPYPLPTPPLVPPLEGEGNKAKGAGRVPTPPLKPLPPEVASASKAPLPKLGLRSLAEIKIMDDLKKIELMHLRQGKLLEQIKQIKDKIIYLAAANKVLPYYAVQAFEQSPIFKTYLEVGSKNLAKERTGAAPSYDPLTLQEFEAVADLRKEIEKL